MHQDPNKDSGASGRKISGSATKSELKIFTFNNTELRMYSVFGKLNTFGERETVREIERERERERETEREREREKQNRVLRCSPETKTETKPNRSVFKFLTTGGVGSVRFFGIRFSFGEP